MTKASRNTLVLKRPSQWFGETWRDALPAGNGLTGILDNGAVGENTVIINRGDLWNGSAKNMPLPDISESLGRMRALMDEGKYHEANSVMHEALKESGYRESLASPYPLCALRINREYDLFCHYRRGIHLESAELFAEWEIGGAFCERRAFVSRISDCVFYKIKTNCKEKIYLSNPDFGIFCPEDISEQIKKNTSSYADAENGFIFYASSFDGEEAGAVLRIYTDGEIYPSDNNGLCIDADEYTLIIKTFKGSRDEYFEKYKTLLSGFGADTYDTEYQKSLADYSPLYSSADINLASDKELSSSNEELIESAYDGDMSPALLEKLWRFGRYLFISGTAEGANPFSQYGLWHGDYKLIWTQNVANENIQMIYRHADVGGLSSAVKPMIKYYSAKLDAFEENARQIFGCRGIHVPAYTTPVNSGPAESVPVILNWISGAAWLSQHFYNYYAFTKDKETLKEDILPFMFKTAEFYEDYLKYSDDGKAIMYPSISPENSPLNLTPKDFNNDLGHACPCVKNALMDFALMKEVLINLCELSTGADEKYQSKIPTWKKLLSSIPEYTKNGDGAICEWLDDELIDNYNHRHVAHLYPLFPGKEVSVDSDPELLAAFGCALDMRQMKGLCAWSYPHFACIYARLGRGESAMQMLDCLGKSVLTPNFMLPANDWRHMGVSMNYDPAPIQHDAIMGVVETVQEMLVYPRKNTVRILPALPERIKSVNARDLHVPFGKLSIDYESGKRCAVRVVPSYDCDIELYYLDKKICLNLCKNNEISLDLSAKQ